MGFFSGCSRTASAYLTELVNGLCFFFFLAASKAKAASRGTARPFAYQMTFADGRDTWNDEQRRGEKKMSGEQMWPVGVKNRVRGKRTRVDLRHNKHLFIDHTRQETFCTLWPSGVIVRVALGQSFRIHYRQRREQSYAHKQKIKAAVLRQKVAVDTFAQWLKIYKKIKPPFCKSFQFGISFSSLLDFQIRSLTSHATW